ncbi:flagellar hook assembly protein FlgD [Acetomicrobium hydrogeniformans]|jgi:flagellar basal-body rod modification protein FlgD|uniref:Flagellar hook capping protein n=2 Tax=Acetomicrobium hydrogeniformans TaxID=649746 RepID=A0A0T5XB63_9BACT|nr:flagellar hook assembly protein FlgD [Acetomicrobium hydrogeniformans]KRT35611.1 flagellar hook capping protein [Acetomicrobium hydrogeniformans ATCC BAA-1850]HHZ04888.1 flagellar hook assembly protein FlgD [Acetomicrobium hydrogeniformans]
MAVNQVSSVNQSYYSEGKREIKNELGKDDFLKLLITQLTHQDPLEPVSDTEFIAQMAQFSTLEQMTNVAKGVESLLSVTKLNAQSYIGKEVIYYDDNTGLYQQSSVRSALFEDGEVYLELENGKYILLDEIKAVTTPSTDGG